MHHFFAACLPGVEPLLLDELLELGVAGGRDPAPDGRGGGSSAGGLRVEAGGVSWRGPAADVHRVHLGSALATHLLLRLGRFEARSFAALRQAAGQVRWADWLPAGGGRVGLAASARASRLYHTGAIAERVAAALEEECPGIEPTRRRAVPEDVDPTSSEGPPPELAVLVRVVEDHAAFSLDLTGIPMHRRGYRLRTAKAPLREDLAAALVRASGWRPGEPLFDPMAGSGTVVLEAARRAAGILPGEARRFAVEGVAVSSALADPELRVQVRALLAAHGPRGSAPAAPLIASDRDAGAVEAVGENAARAGVADLVERRVSALSDSPGWRVGAEAPRGALVTNPPYGLRVGGRRRGRGGGGGDLRPLYQSLGKAVRMHLQPDWEVALCAADRRLALTTGLPLRTLFLTRHGGLAVRALGCRAGGVAPSGGEDGGGP